ncbi:OmpA family protein [Flectobacillus major]|uniref:OmpA family protein n=1 Tax=Flectobacillus major TaxID=103 RepID=UPI00040B934C|nr:OmpA family protein [Flectobacillus major]
MKQVCLTILFCVIALTGWAQKTYWASKVVAFSSEYYDTKTTKENRAIQVLGKPNKLPQIGYSACAWQPLTQNNTLNEEYILVQFDTIMPIRQIAIAENYGQGCITHIDAFDEYDNIRPIWINQSAPSNEIGKMLNLILNQPTNFKVKGIRISLNTSRVKGWNQIDAIGISQSEQPIMATINLATNLPNQIVKENLGKGVNSEFREIAPVISPDGKTLYYTRWKHPDNIGIDKNQDIWYSELQNDKTWGPAKQFPEPINNAEHNAVCAISPDGKTLLLNNVYLKNGKMTKGVSISQKTATGWSFPTQLNIKNFVNKSDYAEYSFSPNGRVLVLTAYLNDTEGGKDIYVSFLEDANNWSEPINIGKQVNTAEDESTPFIAADSKTLYFSTKGIAGYGNNDLFVTRRLDDTWQRWSEPENLGPMINTPEWDGYFSISAIGDFGYFSSQEKSLGEEDIFKLKIPESIKPEAVIQLTGGVYNLTDKKPVGARIKVQSTADGDTVCVTFDPITGDYKLMLPSKKKYTISATQKGYLPMSETLDFLEEKSYKELKKNLYLLPIQAGQKMVLNSVFFEQSKYDLLPASYSELNHIVETMKDNPNMEVMLEGHTDNQGDWNANLQLSKQRVNEVRKYLVSNGIAEKRIQIQGYGSTRPVASNNSEEKRKLNRRVEFIIIKN